MSVLWDWCYRMWTGWAGVSIVGLVLQDADRVIRCQYCGTGVAGSVLGGPVSVKCGRCYRISTERTRIYGTVRGDLKLIRHCWVKKG